MFKLTRTFLCATTLMFLASCEHKAKEATHSTPTEEAKGKHSATSEEAKGIQNVADNFITAWNQHNAQVLANLWTADGDFLSPWNQTDLIKGHAALEKYFSDEYQANMKSSSVELNIDRVRMIDPDTAFVEADFTITGMTIAGVPAVPFHNNAVFLLVKQDGKWKIQIARPY